MALRKVLGPPLLVDFQVQAIAWNHHVPQVLLSGSFDHTIVMVSLEDGTVEGFDIRAAKSDQSSDSKTSFTLHAHDKVVCTVSYNPLAPNVKLWDLSNNQPSCVASNNPKAGAVFSISFLEDSPFLLAIGGSKGKLEASGYNFLCFMLLQFSLYFPP
ncbi:putative WD repeat-containing protein C17D11.16 [Camellia lanceoleosa]|uniref:WD repeat-containing protein C17D11.16 n=1 Tax=Camellia lanceoleosa TaxID=1840588 RepID=A0ACC0HDE2_9ERIC|nr:putative WD repeat-containing protein C17D11.16 [Camellia lanceoleosa]